MIMDLIISIILLAAVAGYLASLACRFALKRNRQPGWLISICAALMSGLLAVLLMGGVDLFQPSKWDEGKVSIWIMVGIVFAFSSAVALLPSLFLVILDRKRFTDSHPAV